MSDIPFPATKVFFIFSIFARAAKTRHFRDILLSFCSGGAFLRKLAKNHRKKDVFAARARKLMLAGLLFDKIASFPSQNLRPPPGALPARTDGGDAGIEDRLRAEPVVGRARVISAKRHCPTTLFHGFFMSYAEKVLFIFYPSLISDAIKEDLGEAGLQYAIFFKKISFFE